MKIGLAMIVEGVDKEAEPLSRALSSVAQFVDGVFITITHRAGEEISQRVVDVANLFNATISHYEWCYDFAAARNFNFSQVPKEYDFIFWIDADDVINGAEKLRATIESNSDTDAFALYYIYAVDDHGNPSVVHLKTQIVRNDGCVEWAGSLHEDFKENRKVSIYLVEGVERRHMSDDKRFGDAKARNEEVAMKQLEKEPNDPRSYWNLGNSKFALGKHDEALSIFKKFLELSSSDEEKYIVHLRVSECLWSKKDYNAAIDGVRYAIGLRPEYPDAYNTAGMFYLETGQYDLAINSFKMALSLKPPYRKIIVFNPRDYDYTPLMNLAKAYFSKGYPQLALPALKACLKIYPKNDDIRKLVGTMQKEAKKADEVMEIVKKLGKITDKEKLRKALDKIPKKYQSHPAVCNLRNLNFIKEQSSGKDVVIFCGQTAEEWTPDTAKKVGIGGSEEAVINLSKKLTERGWNVTVYNSCGYKEKKYGKVLYRPFWQWNYRDKQDVVVLWRHPLLAKYEINSPKVFVDLHDVLPAGEFNEERMAHITKVFVKSQFHRSLYPNIPDEKIAVVPNGIDPKVFDAQAPERDPMLIINTSSPDRSLSACLRIFRAIKQAVPEAKFAWAYGWKVFDVTHSENPRMMEWKSRMIQEMEELGVMNLGRLSHGDIANLYLSANVFLYPTEFAEIHCISAAKAQAAGAIPVTTDFAALNETVIFGDKIRSIKTKDDWVESGQFDFGTKEEKDHEFVEAVCKKLITPPQESERTAMREYIKENASWDNVADAWISHMQ